MNMNCRICGKSLFEISGYLQRVSPKGLLNALWECRPSCGANLSQEEAVLAAIESEETAPPVESLLTELSDAAAWAPSPISCSDPIAIVDLERGPFVENSSISMHAPMADPCPLCGAFRLKVGDYVCWGACDICLDETYEQDFDH